MRLHVLTTQIQWLILHFQCLSPVRSPPNGSTYIYMAIFPGYYGIRTSYPAYWWKKKKRASQANWAIARPAAWSRSPHSLKHLASYSMLSLGNEENKSAGHYVQHACTLHGAMPSDVDHVGPLSYSTFVLSWALSKSKEIAEVQKLALFADWMWRLHANNGITQSVHKHACSLEYFITSG